MKGRKPETDEEFRESGGKIVEHYSGGLTPLIAPTSLRSKEQNRTNKKMAETNNKRGRVASPLTQAKKDFKEGCATLLAMVQSYISNPSELKAFAINEQLANVEVSQSVLRNASKDKDENLFAKYAKRMKAEESEETEEEDSDEETSDEAEEEEEEEETPEPAKPVKPTNSAPKGGMVTARTQQAGKKK